MKVTYYGHSCLSVAVGGRALLFDPFITPNELARAVDAGRVPADCILISHGHADHLADAVAIARRTGATCVSNFEITQWLSAQGVANFHPLNHGGTAALDFGRVKFVNAIHSSSFPDGRYAGNPGGFVVDAPEGRFYFSGDTALTLDMQLIADGPPLRWAALCIGDTFTMGVGDAIKAANLLQCADIVGIHYDTFPPIKVDHAAAREQFAAAGKRLHLPGIGESLEL